MSASQRSGTRAYHPNKLSEEAKNTMREYIKKNPQATYNQFVVDIGGKVKCSDAHYYFEKRRIHGPSKAAPVPRGSRPGRTTSIVYKTIWSYPSEKITPATKEAFKDFLEKLNADYRGRFSLIEMKDPSVIEIRESQRI